MKMLWMASLMSFWIVWLADRVRLHATTYAGDP